MNKGDQIVGKIEFVNFPNRGIIINGEESIVVENVLKGQEVEVRITKKKKNRAEARLLQVISKGEGEVESQCPHFLKCGGCLYQHLEYSHQLAMKEEQVKNIFEWNRVPYQEFLPIIASPEQYAYRNKMEFSFGNEIKGGEIVLGLHRRNSMHDIIKVDQCNIVDKDFNQLLSIALEYAREKELTFYNKFSHEGYLRHLVVRKAKNTGEIFVNIVTTNSGQHRIKELAERFMEQSYDGKLVSIVHSINDKVSDVVSCQEMTLLYGSGTITEELLGLRFKISAFSFFQTNTKGAERLYTVVREFVKDTKNKVVFDLYSGTGTIAQVIAKEAKKVIGIEIVGEAVQMASENATLNGMNTVHFIEGDVAQAVGELEEKPDVIIIDPPRDGVAEKAVGMIAGFVAKEIVYVSCNPKSLVRDLLFFGEKGYEVIKVQPVDLFPNTSHVETVVLIRRKNAL